MDDISKATAPPLYAYGMAVMTKDHFTFCTARSREEAAEIVQAVNSFEPLKNTLTELLAIYSSYTDDELRSEFEPAFATMVIKARAAIKLAEGTPQPIEAGGVKQCQ